MDLRDVDFSNRNTSLTDSAEHDPKRRTSMGSDEMKDLGSVAKLASQGLFAPRSLSLDEIRAVCAVALMHVPDHRQVEMVAERPYYEQIDIALALVRCNDAAA
jgi:hypothetical protein